jgi:hypothetical protein
LVTCFGVVDLDRTGTFGRPHRTVWIGPLRVADNQISLVLDFD